MEYAYDKSTNRLIVHLDGSTAPQERLPIWKRAFETSGWKPGGTVCGIARSNTIVADIESPNELIKLASKHKVKKAAFTLKDKDSLTMSQEGLKLISHCMSSKGFGQARRKNSRGFQVPNTFSQIWNLRKIELNHNMR